MRRLFILDLIVGLCCVMQYFRGIAPSMDAPVWLAQFILLGYGLYLLARRGHLTLARWDQ